MGNNNNCCNNDDDQNIDAIMRKRRTLTKNTKNTMTATMMLKKSRFKVLSLELIHTNFKDPHRIWG